MTSLRLAGRCLVRTVGVISAARSVTLAPRVAVPGTLLYLMLTLIAYQHVVCSELTVMETLLFESRN